LDIRGGVVLSVEDHSVSPTSYVVKIDLGTEQRQVVARLKAYYPREELMGKEVVVLCNLPPAEFSGVKSEGMLLTSEIKKKRPGKFYEPP